MKKLLLLSFILAFSVSLFANVNTFQHLNLEKSLQNKLIHMQSDDNEKLPIYTSLSQRYFKKTVQVADESYDIVVFQEYFNSDWQNSERLVFTSGVDFEDIAVTMLMIGTIQENATFLLLSGSLLYSSLFQFVEMSQLTYMLYQEDNGAGWEDVARLLGTVNNDKVETLLYQEYDADWNDVAQIDFAYHANGNVENFILSAVLEENPVMQELLLMENTFNGNGLVTMEEISVSASLLAAKNTESNATSWTQLLIKENEYTAFGAIAQEITKMSLFGMGAPVDFSKTLYTYNHQEMPVRVLYQMADSGFMPFGKANDTTWENSDKDTIIYNAQRLTQDIISYSWDGSGWFGTYAFYFEWNGDGQNTLALTKLWDGTAWVNESQSVMTYQGGVIKTDLYQEFDSGSAADVYLDTYNYSGNSLSNIVTQEKDGNDWVNTDRTLFTWGSPTPVVKNKVVAREFSLKNYPNPFNPETTIEYQLPVASEVTVAIFDIQGRLIQTLVQNQFESAGNHTINWNGCDMNGNAVASGVYFYQLQSAEMNQTKRCLLMK